MKARCEVRNDALLRCTRALGHDGDHKAPTVARGSTTLRNVRVDDGLWQRAKVAADAQGESLSEVIRASLERYAKRHEPL